MRLSLTSLFWNLQELSAQHCRASMSSGVFDVDGDLDLDTGEQTQLCPSPGLSQLFPGEASGWAWTCVLGTSKHTTIHSEVPVVPTCVWPGEQRVSWQPKLPISEQTWGFQPRTVCQGLWGGHLATVGNDMYHLLFLGTSSLSP